MPVDFVFTALEIVGRGADAAVGGAVAVCAVVGTILAIAVVAAVEARAL